MNAHFMTEFKKYKRSKNLRAKGPSIRVNRGYIYLNRALLEKLDCDLIDLYVSHSGKSVLIKAGADYKITKTSYGRGAFSAGPFIQDLKISDGLYLVDECEDGYVFEFEPVKR